MGIPMQVLKLLMRKTITYLSRLAFKVQSNTQLESLYRGARDFHA